MDAGGEGTNGSAGFVLALVTATFLMGSSFVAGKLLLQDGFDPMVLVGWRFIVAATATLPLAFLENGRFLSGILPAQTNPRVWGTIILIGLLQTAGVMSLLFLAMQSISASTAAILLFTNPIWVALLGRVFLGETLNPTRVAGLLFGITGAGLALGVNPMTIFSPNASHGEIIGLSSAFCWACATIVNKRARLPVRVWTLSFWQMGIGGLVVLAVGYARGGHWPAHVSAAQWVYFLWLAIPASTGSFGLWFVALARGGATRASGFLFLAPFFAVILSFLTLGTTLTFTQTLGGILIGLALWLMNRPASSKTNSKTKEQEPLALQCPPSPNR